LTSNRFIRWLLGAYLKCEDKLKVDAVYMVLYTVPERDKLIPFVGLFFSFHVGEEKNTINSVRSFKKKQLFV